MSDADDEWAPLPIGEPARRALRNAGYVDLLDVTRATTEDLAGLHGMGPRGLAIIKGELAARGLELGSA